MFFYALVVVFIFNMHEKKKQTKNSGCSSAKWGES